MKELFLSIIIPVYNAEKYLDDCFESIKRQSFKNYEVIIIDDGSSDCSPQICDLYQREDARVTVFHIKNAGPSNARNLGFRKAKGRYIYCIDNDDYISDEKYFQKIFNEIGNSNLDILLTGATYWKENENNPARILNYSRVPNIDMEKPYDIVTWLVKNKMYETSCWTKVIRRKFLIEYEFFFDETLLVEDLDWNMRFLQKVKTLKLFCESSYVHIYRQNSITASLGEKRYQGCKNQIDVIDKWATFYKNSCDNVQLREAMLSYLSYQFFITLGRYSTLEKKI